MTSDETAITNLLYRYAEHIDAGDLDAAAALFAHARVRMGVGEVGAAEVLEAWRNGIVLYDDGTPRTKHLITNAIVEIDDSGDHATCRSYYTVMQQPPDGALSAVICGRYHDEFERVDDEWRFSFRDYSLHDLVGDMRAHATSWGARD